RRARLGSLQASAFPIASARRAAARPILRRDRRDRAGPRPASGSVASVCSCPLLMRRGAPSPEQLPESRFGCWAQPADTMTVRRTCALLTCRVALAACGLQIGDLERGE